MAEKKGLLGGNLLPKILILVAVGLVVSTVIFGLPLTIPDLIFTIIRVVIGVGILVLAIKIMEKIIIPDKQFSPTESWKTKLIKVAEMSKPSHVRELLVRGEDMMSWYSLGRITGLMFIPNWAGNPLVDEKTGKFVYEPKKDKLGNLMYDNNGKPMMINKCSNVTEKDGDWLFVVTKGFIPAFSKKILVRASVQLCSDIGEKVWLKCVNVVPMGDFYYPNSHWQGDIVRINMQHSAETVEETLNHYLDLWSNTTEASIKLDPTYVKMMQSNTESISQKDTTPIQSLNGR